MSFLQAKVAEVAAVLLVAGALGTTVSPAFAAQGPGPDPAPHSSSVGASPAPDPAPRSDSTSVGSAQTRPSHSSVADAGSAASGSAGGVSSGSSADHDSASPSQGVVTPISDQPTVTPASDQPTVSAPVVTHHRPARTRTTTTRRGKPHDDYLMAGILRRRVMLGSVQEASTSLRLTGQPAGADGELLLIAALALATVALSGLSLHHRLRQFGRSGLGGGTVS